MLNSDHQALNTFRRRTFSEAPQLATGDQAGGTLDSADVGQMKIGHFTAHKSCVVQHPFAMAGDTPGYLMIAVQKRGQCDFEQQGRTMRLPAGSWGLCDAPKPCLSRHTAGGEQVHFLIPREQIRLGIDPRFAVGRTFTGTSKVASLMCQTIDSLFDELPSLGARQAEELGDIALRLFHIAVNERIAQPAGASPHEDMRERIRNFAESRLRDPRLSLDQIASGLNCTKRYLHMVFASEPQTLNQYIWARRLERSRQELKIPRCATAPSRRSRWPGVSAMSRISAARSASATSARRAMSARAVPGVDCRRRRSCSGVNPLLIHRVCSVPNGPWAFRRSSWVWCAWSGSAPRGAGRVSAPVDTLGFAITRA